MPNTVDDLDAVEIGCDFGQMVDDWGNSEQSGASRQILNNMILYDTICYIYNFIITLDFSIKKSSFLYVRYDDNIYDQLTKFLSGDK